MYWFYRVIKYLKTDLQKKQVHEKKSPQCFLLWIKGNYTVFNIHGSSETSANGTAWN